MHSLPTRARGFSILEAMVSLIVVSLGLGGILMAQSRAISAARQGGYSMQATLLAQQILDQARATSTPLTQADIDDWKLRVVNTLPNGQGDFMPDTTKKVPDTGKDIDAWRIKITWNEKLDANDGIRITTVPLSDERFVVLDGFR